jgi:nicotinic acid mononucleotide adenylyltransferase
MQLARFHPDNTHNNRLDGEEVEEMKRERERNAEAVKEWDVWLPHDTRIDPQDWYWMMGRDQLSHFRENGAGKWGPAVNIAGIVGRGNGYQRRG